MSSLIDSGKTAEDGQTVRDSICPVATNGKHRWEKYGVSPSTWHVCKLCRQSYFDK